MKKILILIFLAVSFQSFGQSVPFYITKWVRLYQNKMQYDSLRNGTWRNLATEAYADASGGGSTYSNGYGLNLASTTFSVDTNSIATKAYRQKGIDSVAALATGRTLQNVMTAGSTLTSAFTVNGSNNDLRFTNFNNLTIDPDSLIIVTPNVRLDSLKEGIGTKAVRYNPTSGELSYADTTSASGMTGSLAVSLTDATTITVDASLGYTIKAVFYVTIGGNRTMAAPTNPTNGQTIVFRITQDGTGGRTITWDGIYRFSTDLPTPTLSTGAGYVDYVAFAYNSTDSKWDVIGVNIGVN